MKSIRRKGIHIVLALAMAAAAGTSAEAAGAPQGDGGFGAAQKLSSIINSDAPEGCPIETPDGLSLMFASARPASLGGLGGNDIYVSDRDSLQAPWSAPVLLPAPINSPAADFCPTPVYGRSLFFVSDRAENAGPTPPCGGGDMYLSRQSPSGSWSEPAMLECYPSGPNFRGAERSPSLVQTWFGTFLFYSSTGLGTNHDIYMSRLGANGKFGPGELVKELSTTQYNELMPNVRARPDGSFEIVFSSDRPTWGKNLPAFGNQDVYYARSWWLTGLWGQARNLGDKINTPFADQRATLSRDGKRLYLGSNNDLYVVERQ
jgi:hypothetical protein